MASSTNWCPSTRSPGSATYKSPGRTSRESHVIPVIISEASMGSTMNFPPVYWTICFELRRMDGSPYPRASPADASMAASASSPSSKWMVVPPIIW